MQAPGNHQANDLVSLAVAATKQLPTTEGPSAEIVAHTSAVLRQAANRNQVTLLERIQHMSWTTKTSALVGIAASILIVFVVLSNPTGTSIAFSQVVEKLKSARTLVYDTLVISEADGKVLSTTRNYYQVPGKLRTEAVGGSAEAYSVLDTTAGKMMSVSGPQKTAYIGPIKSEQKMDIASMMIEGMRSMTKNAAKPIGEKKIDGVDAKGFEVALVGRTFTVWADAKSGEPLQIDIPEKNLPGGPAIIRMTHFKLDEELDAGLFSLEPPAGYTVKPIAGIDVAAGPAQNVAGFLRIYAKLTGGEFPDRLQDAMTELAKKFAAKANSAPEKIDTDTVVQMSGYGGTVTAITMAAKQGRDWQYYPGVRLGEKDRLVFWFHDRMTDTYTAVYGDLRVEKIAKDQLPAGK